MTGPLLISPEEDNGASLRKKHIICKQNFTMEIFTPVYHFTNVMATRLYCWHAISSLYASRCVKRWKFPGY